MISAIHEYITDSPYILIQTELKGLREVAYGAALVGLGTLEYIVNRKPNYYGVGGKEYGCGLVKTGSLVTGIGCLNVLRGPVGVVTSYFIFSRVCTWMST